MGFPINPPNTPLVDPRTGLIRREWYKFFRDIQTTVGVGNPFDDTALLVSGDRGQVTEEDIPPPPVPPAGETFDLVPPRPPAECFDELLLPPRTGSVRVLDDLDDVDIDAPVNRQGLVYNSATGRWENDEFDLDDLGDVEITTPADRDMLIYDSGTQLWKNDSPDLDDLADVSVTTPADGHLLIYDNAAGVFENAALIGGTNIDVTNGAGTVTVTLDPAISLTQVEALLIDDTNLLLRSSTTLADGSAANVGTLNNAPAAGDPTKWVSISDNGTLRWIPTW